MKTVLIRCDSTCDLYPPHNHTTSNASNTILATQLSGDLCHARLGHPGHGHLCQILQLFDFHCSKDKHSCHACHLGKSVRLPFSYLNKVAAFPFTLLHCDVWTSLVVSNSGFKYYLVILDDFTHYVWTFPLRHKSNFLATFVLFHGFVQTQFQCSIACLQANNGKEFVNHALRSFLAAQGMGLRLACPYTSQ
jgi:transposase InsO family protein